MRPEKYINNKYEFRRGTKIVAPYTIKPLNMKTHLVKAETRGHADHGWLNAWHSFSFASFYDPARVHFGALRVLNDDTIAGGQGFGQHPHDNMEIVTIPLSGALEHKDSMGNHGVIRAGEMQVMSAGTGIYHSEFNHSKTEQCKIFQIWIFPNKKNVNPRYDQIKLDIENRKNKFQQLISPDQNTKEGSWIHQDAWFHMISLEKGKEAEYVLKKSGNGVYVMLVEGAAEIENSKLGQRDALEVTEADTFKIKADENSELLLIEVPMK